MSKPAKLVIDYKTNVNLRSFYNCVVNNTSVELSDSTENAMLQSRKYLEEAIGNKKPIYGVTTGFGPLANIYIPVEDAHQLQKSLIRMVCTGIGDPLSEAHVRALMLARLINLSKGRSAVTLETSTLLGQFINLNIIPRIPRYGTVGASGDLSPLAQMSLCLIGEGRVTFDGREQDSSDVLKTLGLQPLQPKEKEGLALINGTSVMTGIAALNSINSQKLMKISMAAAVLYSELFGARQEAFDPLFASVRQHAGQIKVTNWLNNLFGSSQKVNRAEAGKADTVIEDGSKKDEIIQDFYSIRCIPQIFGAIQDTIEFHNGIIETELNAVTDNPLVFADDEKILSGGNFMGSHVALASDALKNAIINLSIHSERVIARVVDPLLNNDLPAYLQPYKTGLQSGFMSAQVSATSILGHLRSLATPASIQSIPTNGNNQDVVSMGTLAAQKVADILHYGYRLLSIELLMLSQAFEIRGGFESGGFSECSTYLAGEVRKISSFVKEDRPLYQDIEQLAQMLTDDELENRVCEFMEINT